MQNGFTLNLEKSIGSAGKHAIWEFHRGENSYMRPPDYTPWRHATLLPAEPSGGQVVQVAICRPGLDEAEWIPVGEGIARYESER